MGERLLLQQLTHGIILAGGSARFSTEMAQVMANEVWDELKALGTDAFPCMVQRDDLRFVYQWDEHPPVLTVMLWDEEMWRDMARIELPAGE